MSARAPGAYARLAERFAHLAALEGAQSVLDWDWSAIMPAGGAEARGRQRAALERVCHGLLADPALERPLAAAQDEDLDPWQRANLGHMRRRVRRARALSPDFVARLSALRSASEMRWRRARRASDYAAFLETFRPLLAASREAGAAYAEALGLDPYDALIDAFDPGLTSAAIDPLFDDLAADLPALLDRVLAHQRSQPPAEVPKGPFPIAAQRALCLRLMARFGFDFDHGRLDVSDHPFCGGVPEDVRITTRYDENDFTSALMGVLHETGHALYERGLPADWRGQPVGEAAGMVAHESQSLFVEMQLCRSDAFLALLVPLAVDAFADHADTTNPAFSAVNFARLYRRVARGFIRVEADELTYPLHVLLRYRLEKALLAGSLAPEDLPAAWNEGMEALLGVRPPDDRLGCLQDIHWAQGLFGYFPTYALGALAAAQLYAAARRELPAAERALAAGDPRPYMAWLGERVHAQGARMGSLELIERATGEPLGTAAFKRHLKARYLAPAP